MRMHQTSPSHSSTTSNGADEISLIAGSQSILTQANTLVPAPVDRYCSDCDIRFSSTSTYRAHKQLYCQSRRREGYVIKRFKKLNKITLIFLDWLTVRRSHPHKNLDHKAQVKWFVHHQNQRLNHFLHYQLTRLSLFLIQYLEMRVLYQCKFYYFSYFNTTSGLTKPFHVFFRSSLASNITSNPDNTCFVLQNATLTPIAYSLAAQVAVQQSQVPSQCPSRETQSAGSATQDRPESVINRSAEVLKDVNKKTEGGK